MERCPKDEPTAKNLVCRESLFHSRERLEKHVSGGGGGGGVGVTLTIGGLTYNYTYHVKLLYIQYFDSGDRQMIYTIIISLLIEKPFYLLRQQSFSCQIVSEFIDTFVKFSNFMSQGWGI